MIDYFALALTHGLLAIAVWRMLGREDLDHETEGVAGDPVDPVPGDAAVPTYRDGRPKDGLRRDPSGQTGQSGHAGGRRS